MVNERRKFKRFDVSLVVASKSSRESDEYFMGVTKNFSRGGLCFESKAFGLPLEAPLEFMVKLPDKDTFVPVSGNIAWKEQFEDKCRIGIQLGEMHKEAKIQILDHAYDLWVEEKRKLKSAG